MALDDRHRAAAEGGSPADPVEGMWRDLLLAMGTRVPAREASAIGASRFCPLPRRAVTDDPGFVLSLTCA
jgi:hypothetical protein